jgi:hypothetical protein
LTASRWGRSSSPAGLARAPRSGSRELPRSPPPAGRPARAPAGRQVRPPPPPAIRTGPQRRQLNPASISPACHQRAEQHGPRITPAAPVVAVDGGRAHPGQLDRPSRPGPATTTTTPRTPPAGLDHPAHRQQHSQPALHHPAELQDGARRLLPPTNTSTPSPRAGQDWPTSPGASDNPGSRPPSRG